MDDIIVALCQRISDLSNIPSHGSATLDSLEWIFKWLTINNTESPASTSQHHSLLTGDIQQLIIVDTKLDIHMKSILKTLDTLAHPNQTRQDTVQMDLLWEQSNLHSTLHEVRELGHHPSIEIQVLAEAMQEWLEQFSATINLYLNILHKRAPPPSNPWVVQTGKMHCHIQLSFINMIP